MEEINKLYVSPTSLLEPQGEQQSITQSVGYGIKLEEPSNSYLRSEGNVEQGTEPTSTNQPGEEIIQIGTIDPDNVVFNSFLGVNRVPVGRIEIEPKPFAGGAFGQVYRGKWGERPVALKKIDLGYAGTNLGLGKEELLESLGWEIARLSTVTHPNIVTFYGIYQHERENHTHLVMEFCKGGELRKKLHKEPNIPWSKRWQWSLEITQALAYLHHEGVLHRDLKAENVLLDHNDRAKLADLGVAQVDSLVQEDEATAVAIGLQDPKFIAPENIKNPTLSSKATDIYALGLVFWEIATNKPVRGLEKVEYFKDWAAGNQLEREPIPVDCPEPFKKLILYCWQYDDKKRPSAEELTNTLYQIGPQLNEQSALVQNCQHLEDLIHPKRKEGLAYIAPFVTEHKVEEPIESYLGRFENPKPGEKLGNPPLQLDDTFNQFVQTPGNNTLLLLGEAGLGKTLTTYLWADQLLSQWWAYIGLMVNDNKAPAYFPIFIRPTLKQWSHKELQGAFVEAIKKYNLPGNIPLLVFVDGYDELQLDQTPTNLVNHLGLNQVPHVKLVVTCRPNTVEHSELDARFSFNGNLTTRYFLPFKVDQLLGYLQKELSWEKEIYDSYKKRVEDAQALRTVLRNPFILYLMRQAWTTISQKPLHQLNRWQIYEGFVEHTINTQKSLLSENLQNVLQGNYPDLLYSYRAFSSDIALKAFQNNGITLGWKEAPASSWVHLKDHAQNEAKAAFAKKQEELQTKLENADPRKKEQLKRRSLLKAEDYVAMVDKRRQQFESELPLKLRGEETDKRYEYIHKSLFEYGIAKRLTLLKHSSAIVEEATNLLQKRPIQAEKEVLVFWEEGWGVEKVNVLTEPFFEIIQTTRQDPSKAQASANAATLLAAAHVPFSGRNLSGVHIPKADLSNTVCHYTSFYQANLQDVTLYRAWLRDTDLREANMMGIYFGEYPNLQFESGVQCVSYSSDGMQMAVGTGVNIELLRHDGEAYKPIATLKGHTRWVYSVTYSPDGKQLASGSDENMVYIWDTASYQEVTKLNGHKNRVGSLSYSPDGKQLASGSYDNMVILWDTSSYRQLSQLKGHTGWVRSVSFSPDGKQLASGSDDRTVIIWETGSYKQVTQLKSDAAHILSVCYSPDGKHLATGNDHNDIRIWEMGSHKVLTLLKGHTGWIYSVSYSPDGKQLATGSRDNTIRIWETGSYQEVTQLKGHRNSVQCVCYSPDGKQLATGSDDKTVRIWETRSHQEVTQLKGHTSSIRNLSYSPDGKQLASGSSDCTVRIWDMGSHQELTQLKGHSDNILSVRYSPDGKYLASGSDTWDNTVIIWETGSHQKVTQLRGHTDSVFSVSYSPDGKQLASGSSDCTVRIWDMGSHQELTMLRGHTTNIRSVSYSPDGKQLASGSDDKTVRIWDTANYQLVTQLKGHTDSVFSVSYSPDGKQLATGSGDKTVCIWSASHQQVTQLNGHTDRVLSVTYSPDGKQLATGSDDKTIRIWETGSYQEVAQLKGHTGEVGSVSYSPDSKQIASGSRDQGIYIWSYQRAAGLPGGPEAWQLMSRLERNHVLSVEGALLKGANMSANNLELLKQKGANNDQDTTTIVPK